MVIEGQQRCERSLKAATVCVPLVCASPHGCVLCAFRPAFFPFGIPPPTNKQSSGRSSRARCSRRGGGPPDGSAAGAFVARSEREQPTRRGCGPCCVLTARPLCRRVGGIAAFSPAGRRSPAGTCAGIRIISTNTQEFASDRRMDRRGFRAPPAAAHRLPGNSRRADSTRKFPHAGVAPRAYRRRPEGGGR